MNPKRLDALLDEVVTTGTIPADASPSERAEIEAMLGAMGLLQASRLAVDDETEASMPTARARFQRYVAAASTTGSPAPRTPLAEPRRGMFGRLFPDFPVRALVGSAAGIGLLVLVVLLVSQFAFSGTESAYAQVVQPGDYVQVEGVVDESRDGSLRLTSELGPLDVELSESTSFVDGTSAGEVSSLKRGHRVLVGGIAGENGKLHAQTLSLGPPHEGPPPRMVSFRHLQHLRDELEGQVVTFTISSDATRGAVIIVAGDGQRYLVPLDGPAAEELLSRASTALGQKVKITEGSGVAAGRFSVDMPVAPESSTPPGSPPDSGRPHGHPSFANVRGVVTGIDQRPATEGHAAVTIATVQTAQERVTVVVRPQARILGGKSGLDVGAGLPSDAVGHMVSISGGVDKATGSVVADVIVIGMKFER